MYNCTLKVGLIALLIGVLAGIGSSACRAEGEFQQQIVIKVQPGVIGMPDNKVTRVPIGYARIRSTELRDLNEIYHARTIEKMFVIKQVGSKPPEKVEVKDTYIIKFTLEPGMSLQALVDDYEKVPAVLAAQVEP